MRNYTCACIGTGKDLNQSETAALAVSMEKLITEHGVRHFLCGMERGLELSFGEQAALLRDSKYPFATLDSVIPYEEQAADWSEDDRDRYYDLAARCDRERMLNRSFVEGCMTQRDCFLMEKAYYMIVGNEEGFTILELGGVEI